MRSDLVLGGGNVRSTGLKKNAATIWLNKTRGNFEQSRFARPVPPDQADALALANGKPGAIKERFATKG